MNTKPFRMDRRQGSALLASMIVVTVLSFACAGILSYSLNTYENSVRQGVLDQAREVADGEMEYLYYGWKDRLMHSVLPSAVAADAGMLGYETTGSQPFITALHYPAGQPQWVVTRAVTWIPVTGTADGSAEGVVNGNLIGKNFYF